MLEKESFSTTTKKQASIRNSQLGAAYRALGGKKFKVLMDHLIHLILWTIEWKAPLCLSLSLTHTHTGSYGIWEGSTIEIKKLNRWKHKVGGQEGCGQEKNWAHRLLMCLFWEEFYIVLCKNFGDKIETQKDKTIIKFKKKRMLYKKGDVIMHSTWLSYKQQYILTIT